MKTAQIIDFDLTVIARRIRENFTGEQSDEAQATTLAERKQARRKAIAEDLALVQENPPAEGFQAWVKTNCPFSVWTAYEYVKQYVKTTYSPDGAPDAPEQPKKRNKGGRPKATPKAGPQTWLQAIVLHFGGYPKGFSHAVLAGKNSAPRAAIEAECGFAMVPSDPTKHAAICAAVQRLIDRADPPAAAKRIDAEVKTLSETAQAKLERLALAKAEVMRAELMAQVSATVDAQMKSERERLAAAEARANAEFNEWNAQKQHVNVYLNREEFDLIRSCLHPDREATADRKARAFAAFNKLLAYVDPSKRERAKTGWPA